MTITMTIITQKMAAIGMMANIIIIPIMIVKLFIFFEYIYRFLE